MRISVNARALVIYWGLKVPPIEASIEGRFDTLQPSIGNETEVLSL